MNIVQIKEEEVQSDQRTSFSSSHLSISEVGKVKLEENGDEEAAQTLTGEIDEELLAVGDLLSDESSPSKSGSVFRPNRSGKQKGVRWERQKWLQNRVPYTYRELIAMAINSQPDKRATLAEIYEFLRVNFDCFRGPYTGWKNCIRHTLTLAKSFHKEPRAERAGRVGLGNYWALSEHRQNLAGGLGRRSRKTEVREMLNAGGMQNLRLKEAAKQSERSAEKQNDTSKHWEQQQSNDVEDLLRRIGIANTLGKKDGDKDTANAEHRLRQPTTALSEADAIAAFEMSRNKAKGNGGGKKLDLLLDKMGHLKSVQCLPSSQLPLHSVVPFSPATHFQGNAVDGQLLSPRLHQPMAPQMDHLLTHSLASSFSSLTSSLFKSVPSSVAVQQQLQRHHPQKGNGADEEVITVDEDDDVKVEEEEKQRKQQQNSTPFCRHKLSPHSIVAGGCPSVAAVAQMSAWLGLVAGEMRLRLQCDGKNGSMVLSPNCQGRPAHRLQFVPGNDRELVIRQFTGDQLYQEKKWTWYDHQEEQTLHAIRGICFHFFFCH